MAGDVSAMEEVIKRHFNSVFNFVYRYVFDKEVAEDVTQDTFYKVWKNIHQFDQTRKFKTWLLTIAKNTANDSFKKKKAVAFSNFETAGEDNVLEESLEDPLPLAEELFERKELVGELERALENIEPHYRSTLLLHYHEHLKFAEIAEIFEKPLNTIKSWHRRSLIALRKELRV